MTEPSGPRHSRHLLVAEGLSCVVAGRRLFQDLDICVDAGDLIEVHGANGSGKSTLLRGLAGLHELHAGRIRRRVDFDYIGHKAGLGERMTPAEHLRFSAHLRGRQITQANLNSALSRVGLRRLHDDLCGTLSAGQQRRAAFARLIACPVELWLLDEPQTALDDAGTALLFDLIAQHRLQGGAAICATHRPLETPSATSNGARRAVTLGA